MKKLFSLLLVLAMVLSMSLAAADSAETIKIGVIAYGSAAARASILGYFMNGWEVAAEQVNAAGGIDGKQIEIKVYGPLFQRLAHNGVVGVGQAVCRNVPCRVPHIAIVVH